VAVPQVEITSISQPPSPTGATAFYSAIQMEMLLVYAGILPNYTGTGDYGAGFNNQYVMDVTGYGLVQKRNGIVIWSTGLSVVGINSQWTDPTEGMIARASASENDFEVGDIITIQ
jgi:hypothetical protein